MSPDRRWQLGTSLPLVLLGFFVADLVLRLAVPTRALSFRAWEAAVRNRPPGAPFEPGLRFRLNQTYGELAAMGNLPRRRRYHPETFSTDANGFRNLPEVAQGRVEAILLGRSFSAGCGVDDGQTLSARLSAVTGRTVYNAAGMYQVDPRSGPEGVRALARTLHMRGGWVLFEWLEGNVSGLRAIPSPPNDRSDRNRGMKGRLRTAMSKLDRSRVWIWLRGTSRVSPLKIWSEKCLKSLQDDIFLPNVYREYVVERRLRSGEFMLFSPSQLVPPHQPGREEEALSYWHWLDAELRKDDFHLMVILVPHKFNVYRPLLEGERDSPARAEEGSLDRLERGLKSAGIPVVNLTLPLRREAARRGERTLYSLDDNHWNADGIEVAAEEIERAWMP